MRSAAALLLLLAASLALAPSAGAASLDAGGVRAHTSDSPWSLRFTDGAGRTVLAEAEGHGSGRVGTLGFRTEAGWFHATRALSGEREGRGFSARLATSDPSGRTLSVRLAPDARGVIALGATVEGPALDEVSSTGIAFRARDGERYLGFGERSNAVDQRGREVESYVAEGPYEEDERPVIPAFVPEWGFHPREDATYFPMPWLLSSAGYGVLLDNAETSRYQLDTEQGGAWSVEVDARELRLRVFAGPRPADVLRRLTARIGRQPRVPAPFVLGPWYQPSGDEENVLRRLQQGDVPLSVAQTYTHYLPCADQRGREEREVARVKRFHDAGLAVTTYFNPMMCTGHPSFDEAARSGALIRNAAGQPYVYRYSTQTSFEVAQLDFTALAGRDLFGRLAGEALEHGHDGWMEDFGEYTPLDARSASGQTGSALHNLYPLQYHCGAHEATRGAGRPLARFVRSGWTGSARCSPIVWGGDPSVDWGFDGLSSVVTNGLTMGLSGVSTWGSDIGGFFSLFENRLTPELLVRWIQVGAVSGVMRTQANGIRIPDSPRPQVWDPEVMGHWRRWAKLRTQLYPYLAAADAEYRRSGLPIMRHLSLAYPSDRHAAGTDDAFLFGPDLLAAPVLEPGASERSLYLPRGRWIDLWRSARYRERDGSLALRSARVLRGGRRVSLPAPLAELPLLVRAGALIPLLPPDVDTLSSYGKGADTVSLSEREGARALLAFPRGRSSARLGDGGVVRSRERRRGWELVLSGHREHRWQLQASLAGLRRPFHPCALKAARGQVQSFRYNRRTRVLRASLTGRSVRLRVLPCRR
ncbi:MAG TPA: TIM-barrel domain-containing protein [Thermoleophilaceae bacterium]|nr:TIM-barrel domain-containing protein [Thermoleophilaceae bacterium]